MKIPPIPMREVLHYLGWRGQPVEEQLLDTLRKMIATVRDELEPRTMMRSFALIEDCRLDGTVFAPQGSDIGRMLESCDEAVLIAATLGAQSERMLIKQQAVSSTEAVLLDAVLSAAIEAVCDQEEETLRRQLASHGRYLTDRFSPGYGDMPIEQTKEICSVLSADRAIGLTVSQSGIMIPRKSVTAVMGVSRTPVDRRKSGCAICAMRETCTLRNDERLKCR